MDVTPADVYAHIKKTWRKDMKNKLKLKDSVQSLHVALPGDARPQPPLTMVSNFFLLNAKYGMSLNRAVELFNGFKDGSTAWRTIDKYLVRICLRISRL